MLATGSSSYNLRPTESSSVSTRSPKSDRQAKTDALNFLNQSLTQVVSPRLEKRSTTLDFQNVQLKGKVYYLYEAQSEKGRVF